MAPCRRLLPLLVCLAVSAGAPGTASAAGWLPPAIELSGPPFLSAATATNASGRSVVAVAARETVEGVDTVVLRAGFRAPGAPLTPGPIVSDNGGAPPRYVRGPEVAIADDGSAIVLWRFEYQPDLNQLRARTIAPDGTLGEIQDLTPATGENVSTTDLDLAVNRAGKVAVVFADQAGQSVWAASGSTTAGFGATQLMVSGNANARVGTAAVDAAGDAIVSWQENTTTTPPIRTAVRASTKLAAETAFPPPQLQIGDAGEQARFPAVAMAPDGRTMVVWSSSAAGRALSYQERLTVDGAWSAPAAAMQPGQALAVDRAALELLPDGTAVVAYRDQAGRVNTAARTGSTFGGYQQPSPDPGAPRLAAGPDGTVVLLIEQGSPTQVLAAVRPPGAAAFTPAVRPGGVPEGTSLSERGATAGVDDEGNVYGLLARYRCPVVASPCPDLTDEIVGFGWDAAAPVATQVSTPDALGVGVPGSFAVVAADRRSAVTTAWTFDDGASTAGSAVSHAFATAGDHTATVTLTDAAGNATTVTRAVAVNAPTAAAPPAEAPGGSVPGGPSPAAPAPTTRTAKRRAGTVTGRFRTRGRRTTVRSLRVRAVPAGARVRLTCTGSGCPFKARTITAARAGKVTLGGRFAGVVLRPGATLRVRVSARGRRTVTATWTMRRGKAPRRR